MRPINLTTLTPLWTGDIERNSSHVKDTSIVGSLRWWYEALVREMDGKACNVTSDNPRERCDYERDKGNICDACKLFGCTGYSRRFRLDVGEINSIPLFFVSHQNVYLSNGNWLSRIFGGKRSKKDGETYFSFDKRMLFSSDPFEIRIKTLDANQDAYHAIYFLLWFVSEYGGLGAKTQNGFGQVKMMNPNDKLLKEGKDYIKNQIGGQENEEKISYDLNDFFSIEFEIEDKNPYYGVGKEIGDPLGFDYREHFIPCAFDVRYKMRSWNPLTKMGENWGMRPFFIEKFGANIEAKQKTKSLLGGDLEGTSSRIFVTHLFKESASDNYHLKIWGFVPRDIEDKEKVVELVKQYIFDRKTFYGARIVKQYKEREVFS